MIAPNTMATTTQMGSEGQKPRWTPSCAEFKIA